MSTCEILVTTDDGQEIAGTFSLDGTKLSAKPRKGYDALMDSVLKESHIVNDKEFASDKDPRSWFFSLPKHFSGTYMRARIL